MTARTDVVACPSWCMRPAGHPYEDDPDPEVRLHEMHVIEVEVGIDYPSTATVTIQAVDFRGIIAEAYVRMEAEDAVMTPAQATELGAHLLLAAGRVVELNREATA